MLVGGNRGKLREICRKHKKQIPIKQMPGGDAYYCLPHRLYRGEQDINHLKLTFVAERPPPPQIVSQQLLMAAEASAEYFS